jgi:SWI/SNF-related matrix-associated actin-dependent regulator 1 of chromatin subfamily A
VARVAERVLMPTLYNYQREGVCWLAQRRRAYLGDAPGLGKTPQLIRAAVQVGADSPLVICPAIARDMWRRQWTRWGTMCGLNIMSYDELVRHTAQQVTPFHDLLILDEAHYARNTSAQRTRLALKLANRAERVWLASGTPLPNGHAGNLYAALRAVWPDELTELGIKNEAGFLHHFCVTVPTDYGLKVVGNRNVPQLREILSRIMLRRTESDEIDLPPLHWEEFFLPATALAPEITELGVEARGWEDDIPQDTHFSTARRLLGELKAPVVGDLLASELEDGAYQKIVVGFYHREVGRHLRERLSSFGSLYIDGQTTPVERARRIQLFQQIPDFRVMVAQLQTAGTAVDLFAANEVALVEQSWLPDDNIQFVKRVHRIGQDRPCRARMFFASCDLDEAVARVLARKIRLRGEIIHD